MHHPRLSTFYFKYHVVIIQPAVKKSEKDIGFSVIVFLISKEERIINLRSSYTISTSKVTRIRGLEQINIVPSSFYASLFEDLQQNKLELKKIVVFSNGISQIPNAVPQSGGEIYFKGTFSELKEKYQTFAIETNNFKNWNL